MNAGPLQRKRTAAATSEGSPFRSSGASRAPPIGDLRGRAFRDEHRPRGDAVDGDLGSELDRERPHEAFDSRLGRRMRGVAANRRRREQMGIARRARGAGAEGSGLPREQESGARVDVHRIVPERRVGVLERRAMEVRRGVDEQIEAAEGGGGVADETGAGRRLGEVRGQGHGAASRGANQPGDVLGLGRGAAVVNGDVRAGLGQGERDRAAEADRGFGHERRAAGERKLGHGPRARRPPGRP